MLISLQTRTANSVFAVAGKGERLCALHTARPKSEDGNHGAKDTLNDAGIYEFLRDAADISAASVKRSTLDEEDKKTHTLGRQPWHHLVVPIEVKNDVQRSAFVFEWERKENADSEETSPIAEAGRFKETTEQEAEPVSEVCCPFLFPRPAAYRP